MLLFSSRRRENEVQGFMLNLANNNCAELEARLEGPRLEGRVRLSLVVLVTPFIGKRPRVDKTFPAVTKELSTSGVSLVISDPRALDEVLLGFRWEHDMRWVRAKAKHLNPMGAGFYQLGFRVLQVMHTCDYPELELLRF